MPHDAKVTLKGSVTDVFFHRFVIKTGTGNVLADLTPPGAEKVKLKAGDEVEIEGEQKPSEVKVLRLVRGSQTFDIPDGHGSSGGGRGAEAPDLSWAKETAEKSGYRLIGEPQKKPKHYEFLGVKAGKYAELHVHGDGLRHEKPVEANDPKWTKAIAEAK